MGEPPASLYSIPPAMITPSGESLFDPPRRRSGTPAMIGPPASSLLLRNSAAGDAGAGITRRVGLHVVGRAMNHQRRAAVGIQRIRFAPHRHVLVGDGGLGVALGVDREVHHVAGVWTVGVL